MNFKFYVILTLYVHKQVNKRQLIHVIFLRIFLSIRHIYVRYVCLFHYRFDISIFRRHRAWCFSVYKKIFFLNISMNNIFGSIKLANYVYDVLSSK